MKLNEIYEIPEVIWENDQCSATIGGNVCTVIMVTELKHQSALIKGAKAFASNPIVLGVGAAFAANAVKQYIKNKHYTTRFFAKTAEERKLYDRIIKDLMATGNYKLVRTKFVDGGKLWELVQHRR